MGMGEAIRFRLKKGRVSEDDVAFFSSAWDALLKRVWEAKGLLDEMLAVASRAGDSVAFNRVLKALFLAESLEYAVMSIPRHLRAR